MRLGTSESGILGPSPTHRWSTGSISTFPTIPVPVQPAATWPRGNLEISIIDEGIGIPAEEQKHVFNRYFRAENALLNQGTGIGLNIVKTHLENLNGTITFTSEENVGSAFMITIPITPN